MRTSLMTGMGLSFKQNKDGQVTNVATQILLSSYLQDQSLTD